MPFRAPTLLFVAAVVTFSGTLGGVAWADVVPPEAAREAKGDAEDFRQALDLDKARDEIERAIRIAPDWAEPYQVRASIRVLKAGAMADAEGLQRSLQAINDGMGNELYGDYAALVRGLESATLDYVRYLELRPDAPDAASVRAEMGRLRRLTSVARDCTSALDRRENARRLAVTDARTKAEAARQNAEEIKAAQWNTHRGRTLFRQRLGYALIGLGVAGGGVAAFFAGLGQGENDAIKAGGFATHVEIEDAFGRGAADNTGFFVSAGLGLASLLAGTVIAIVNPDPGPSRPSNMGFSLRPARGLGWAAVMEW